MAELGLVANVTQVIGLGLGLSKLLFEFASTLGSASSDVKSLATNIALFCSVLGQVKTALSKPSRLSTAALDTADEVVRGCQAIFDDLDAKVRKLRNCEDILAKVKWFFKQKSILLVHEQLRTCSATLHLMLTTLVLADAVAARRLSGSQPGDKEENDRMLTNVTFMAQQAAHERLAALEEDAETPSDLISIHRRNRSSRIIDGDVLELSSKRFSVDLDKHMNRLSVVDPIDANSPSEALLRQWTDQGDSMPSSPDDEGPRVQIFKSFRVALEDRCSKVLPAALRKYNIQKDWRTYALYIVYQTPDGEHIDRFIGLEEYPLAIFKDLDQQGRNPMFMLRKLAP